MSRVDLDTFVSPLLITLRSAGKMLAIENIEKVLLHSITVYIVTLVNN